jgi:signal transduction histidine kinase
LLTKRYFHGNAREVYHLQVRTRSREGRIFYDSAPERPFPAAAVNAIGLLSPASVNGAGQEEVECGNSPSESSTWCLVVARDGMSAASWTEESHRMNAAMSATSFLVLGIALVALFQSGRRARDLAACQSEFVSCISHELRTPLAALRSIAENLHDGVVAPPKIRRYGLLMAMQVERLSEMVEDVLEFTRVYPNRSATDDHADPVAAIDDALAAYSSTLEAKGFEVIRDVPTDLPAVRCSSPSLRRALQNLIGNAIKYGAGARWMRIAARRTSINEIVVAVEDRGCGVRPDERDQIFEPFFRGRDVRAGRVAGVGLGLSLVKRSVESAGGRIAVTSEPGRGATFEIFLSASEDHETTDLDR